MDMAKSGPVSSFINLYYSVLDFLFIIPMQVLTFLKKRLHLYIKETIYKERKENVLLKHIHLHTDWTWDCVKWVRLSQF